MYIHQCEITSNNKRKNGETIVQRGVRQRDFISPNICILIFEEMFRTLEWEHKGVTIVGEKLNYLRFADNVALIANDKDD